MRLNLKCFLVVVDKYIILILKPSNSLRLIVRNKLSPLRPWESICAQDPVQPSDIHLSDFLSCYQQPSFSSPIEMRAFFPPISSPSCHLSASLFPRESIILFGRWCSFFLVSSPLRAPVRTSFGDALPTVKVTVGG